MSKTSSNSSSSSSSSSLSSNDSFETAKKKGHPPISITEVLNDRYRIIKGLGRGRFSVVYLSYDYITKDFVALKISRCNVDDIEVLKEEIDIMKLIDNDFCSKLLNSFEYTSIFGTHIVLVSQLHGKNLFSVIKDHSYSGLYPHIVKSITKCILEALIYIESQNLTHSDIKLENIFVKKTAINLKKYKIPPLSEKTISLENKNKYTLSKSQIQRLNRKRKREKNKKKDELSSESESDGEYEKRIGQVVLGDFGNLVCSENPDARVYGTPGYQSIENILTKEFDSKVDIWSLGCVIYELLTGEVLFDNHKFDQNDSREETDAHIASIISITGGDVSIYKDGSYYDEFCRPNGSLRFIKNIKPIDLSKKLRIKGELSKKESEDWSKLILEMLTFDYKQRPSAEKILEDYKNFLDT